MSLWEGNCCVRSSDNVTLLNPEFACVLSDGCHVAIAGNASEIDIVSLTTMNTVLTIQHGHQTWISCMTAIRHLGSELEKRPPLLLSLSEGDNSFLRFFVLFFQFFV